jgi:hypothetical protein
MMNPTECILKVCMYTYVRTQKVLFLSRGKKIANTEIITLGTLHKKSYYG